MVCLRSSLLLLLLHAYGCHSYDLFVDKDAIQQAFLDVKDSDNSINWALLTYQGKQVVLSATGHSYDAMWRLLENDMRAYGFVKIKCEDGVYRIAFITWIGINVNFLKRAKVPTDKAFVKQLTGGFTKEIFTDDRKGLRFQRVRSILQRAVEVKYGRGAK